jgi:hypothetical protein
MPPPPPPKQKLRISCPFISVNLSIPYYDIPLTMHSTASAVQRVLFFLCVHTLLTLLSRAKRNLLGGCHHQWWRHGTYVLAKTQRHVYLGSSSHTIPSRILSFVQFVWSSPHLLHCFAASPLRHRAQSCLRRSPILIAACRKLLLAEACGAPSFHVVVGRDGLVGVWRGRYTITMCAILEYAFMFGNK